MAPTQNPAAWRRWQVLLPICALVAACACGVHACLTLAHASVLGGAYRTDPFVTRVVDRLGPSRLRDSGVDYEGASRLAPLDFRYPYRHANSLWFGNGPGARSRSDVLRAHELFSEAIDRAPTVAEARYYYATTSLVLSEDVEADRSALAALTLAPLHLDLRRKVALYFEDRFKHTRSDAHLEAAFRAMGGERADLIRVVLTDPLISYDRVSKAFASSGLSPEDRIGILMGMERWSWAIRASEELEAEAEDGAALRSMVRVRYAESLIDRGAFMGARREAEFGLELMGDRFSSYRTLARARLLAGDFESGLPALDRALEEGLSVAGAEETLEHASVPPARRAAFWLGMRSRGRADTSVLLALARAYVESDQHLLAQQTLLVVLEGNRAHSPAHLLMAQAFQRSGNFAAALRHARLAVKLDPENRVAKALVALLLKETR